MKKERVFLYPLGILILLFTVFIPPAYAGADGVAYQTHVENIGWQDYVQNGQDAGTTGQSLRLEAIRIKLENPVDMGIEYRTHVEDIGWQDYVSQDQLAGTEGQCKRLEAISIRLNGNDAPNYNVYYRVHAQDYGWLGWAKNGEDAGTAGLAKRLEAIEIILKPVSEAAPEGEGVPFVQGQINQQPQEPTQTVPQDQPLTYRAYIGGIGFLPDWGVNGQEYGSNENGIYAVQINLSEDNKANGGILYRTHSSHGWTPWNDNGAVSGDAEVPIQAIRIKLTGKLAFLKDVYYRLYTPGKGWTNLARNGEPCGSEGYNQGTTLVQIWFTNKAEMPNAAYGNAFNQKAWYWPLDEYHSISMYFGTKPGSTSHHDGIDIPAPEGTEIKSAKDGTVIFIGYGDGQNHALNYGAFGNLVVIENDSGEVCYYAHMSKFNTTLGARVSRGQVIGYVGTTGNSLGNHLHLEIYDPIGDMVDPLSYY